MPWSDCLSAAIKAASLLALDSGLEDVFSLKEEIPPSSVYENVLLEAYFNEAVGFTKTFFN